ncbi:MAG: transcription-repair coupling factor [Planctomycetes bacterium]|nr:transcription-repair coupling factor [Planctomycetota bacterium]
MTPPAPNWLDHLVRSPTLDVLAARVANHKRTVVHGSQGSSTSLITAALAQRSGRFVVLVVPHLDDADDALDDMELFAPGVAAERFGALEVMPGESSVSLDLLAERIGVLGRLITGELARGPGVLVAPIQALMQCVPEPGSLDKLTLTVEKGKELSIAKLTDWLASSGYQRVEAIEQPGEFAVRGGIVDIFPPAGGGDGPIRLDYFGDEIDSIRRIDAQTLGSGQTLTATRLIGATAAQLQSDENTTSLLSLLPDNAVIVMHEMLELAEQGRGYYERLTNPHGIQSPQAVFRAIIGRLHVEINQYTSVAAEGELISAPVSPLPSFDRDAANAVREVAALAGETGALVVVLCPKEAERERLLELLTEHAPEAKERVRAEVSYLHRGFTWELPTTKKADEPGRLILVPHQELFHRYGARRRLRRVMATGGAGTKASDAFLDVAVGDYVVHVDHGIALFKGLRAMKKEGRSEEYLTLEFADQALLHVPATQIDLVQKYVGGFQGRPPLSILGGKRWAKQKEQVAEAVKDMAAELLRVQAARASMPGIRYPTDTPWQLEFEAEFPYEETEDQLAAIGEVKKDMSDEQPMDRLICGDVGFGKTEVAIRAAFKAAEYGKQVAVLVPTTILAEQHERTFRERMADYPFRVESISRYKTGTEARAVLDKLERGEVDVIIGTHRLLSQDVKFADLGLVIIDEEQRFGVEHKHKLMQLRLTVDVLTLSATPIPRTLHMSMLGLRDISSLSTAPLDRRAIVTEVIPYDRERMKRAMVRELNRDGQIYFVHNRVHNIASVADDVRQLVPDARILIGHGQMPGHELEEVMLKFVRREADILVCTTIIESGVDIPTANTIFINQADQFGLADLHQLRGRVGRYKHRAYCYLILPPDRPLTDTAQRRLGAIEHYSMLGAGFKIAMRDLEIRGAGNLLGAEQSGHIAAVGYEMYCQLLEEATRRLKQEERIEPSKTHLELPMSGQLPKAYIPSDKFRMEAYRRISRSATLDELEAVSRDLTDAYGQPPPAAQALLDLTQIRIAAGTLGVAGIKLEGPDLIFRTKQPKKLDDVLRDAPGRASVIDENTVYYRPPPGYLEPGTLAAVLRKLLVRPLREGNTTVK